MDKYWICSYCERAHTIEMLVCAGCGASISQGMLNETISCPDPNKYGGRLEIGTIELNERLPDEVLFNIWL